MKWDALLTDRRHFRSDLRLIRRALLAGWVNEPNELEAIGDRLAAALESVHEAGGGHDAEGPRLRVLVRAIEAALALDEHALAMVAEAMRR